MFYNINDYGVFVPPLLLDGDHCKLLRNNKFHTVKIVKHSRASQNMNYFNEFCKSLNDNVLLSRGNLYIKNNYLKLLFRNDFYYLLNTETSFDANWVKSKYTFSLQEEFDINKIYNYYLSHKCYGNNIETKMGHSV